MERFDNFLTLVRSQCTLTQKDGELTYLELCRDRPDSSGFAGVKGSGMVIGSKTPDVLYYVKD